MTKKVALLVIGLVVGIVGIVVATLIVARADEVPAKEPTQALTSTDIKGAKEKTTGLENIGNLPLVVSGDEIGRSNPFESY